MVALDLGAYSFKACTAAETAATLDLDALLATHLLVQGNAGSGKSHRLRRLMEQTLPECSK